MTKLNSGRVVYDNFSSGRGHKPKRREYRRVDFSGLEVREYLEDSKDFDRFPVVTFLTPAMREAFLGRLQDAGSNRIR